MKAFPELQREFMLICKQEIMGLNAQESYHVDNKFKRTVALWDSLIDEEVNKELRAHLREYIYSTASVTKPREKIIDEMAAIGDDIADSIYVLCGLANAIGIPLTRIFNAVHSANLDKAPNGILKKRADGKILKPDGWKAADIRGIIDESYDILRYNPSGD